MQECECNCGYTCGRQCGLPIMECIKKHYVKDCKHQWDGPVEKIGPGGASVTCSKCGMLAISHDGRYGP